MDPIRLALDVGPLHGHRTGVGRAVEQLVAAYADRPELDVVPYVTSFRARVRPPERRLPLPAGLAHRLWARTDRPRADRWLGRPDVVHGTNYIVPPAAAARVVSVYDCWFLAHRDRAAPAARRTGDVLRRSVAGGAVVHASSEATAEQVRELLATDRVHVVPLAPLPRPAVSPRPVDALGDRPFVLAIGTTERRKNVPALVSAFGCAATDLDGARLAVAGAPGDDEPAVETAVNALAPAHRSRVVRLGAVDESQKAWLLDHASTLAYPSLDEGFGFPVLEAHAAGVPVVATAAGSIPEVAGDGAELVPAGDVEALADALRRVVGDGMRRQELIEAGRENLTRFSWAATAEGLIALYRQVVGRR
jgi:glycosyltransferase involved in cell wall biosynthesis